jgi:hypothetical protein
MAQRFLSLRAQRFLSLLAQRFLSLRAQRSNLVAPVKELATPRDCFVATLLAMTSINNMTAYILRCHGR